MEFGSKMALPGEYQKEGVIEDLKGSIETLEKDIFNLECLCPYLDNSGHRKSLVVAKRALRFVSRLPLSTRLKMTNFQNHWRAPHCALGMYEVLHDKVSYDVVQVFGQFEWMLFRHVFAVYPPKFENGCPVIRSLGIEEHWGYIMNAVLTIQRRWRECKRRKAVRTIQKWWKEKFYAPEHYFTTRMGSRAKENFVMK